MIEFKTNISDIVTQISRWFNRTNSSIQSGAKGTVQEAARIVNAEIVDSIREENAVASGNLLRSVTVGAMTASTEGYEMTVGSSSPYASIVEEGRRAGAKAPPVASIVEWMTQKGIDPSDSAAYLIARKIARDGIPAKRVFEKGVKNAEEKLDAPLNAIMDSSLQKNNQE